MQYIWVILLFLPSALSQRFKVVVPDAHVFSVSGSDVVLSCSVRDVDHQSIIKNAVDLSVNWSRSDLNDSLVHLYGNHEDLNTDQNPSYRGRTAVFKEQLKNGNVSLKLSNVQPSDEGEYTCRVDSKSWVDSKTIKLSVEEFVPNLWKIVGITIGVLLLVGIPAGIFLYIKLLLKSDKDGRLQHHYLSPCQWYYVERTLLNSEEDLKEFNLRKYDPSDRGVEKLQKVIASSKKALLKLCSLTEKSCEVLASVLSSKNSLTELDLSLNKLQDSGVKKLCEGLENSHCKLQNLRLEECDLSEESGTILAKVLGEKNSLIELNLNKNKRLKDSGVEKLCVGLKDKNCELQKLWLEYCDLTDGSCADLAKVLKSENSKLIELNLSRNILKETEVGNLCVGLTDKNCKLKILRLEDCDLREESCADLALVLKSKNSLIELDLSKNKRLKDSGVKNLCDGLKDKNCKLEKLRLAECSITNEGFSALASALIENPSSPLKELDLSDNGLKESELKQLPKLKDTLPELKVMLADCSKTDEGCAALTSALIEKPSSPSEEQDLRDNGLKESEQKLLHEPNDTFV